MIHASCTIVACNDSRYVFGSVRSVAVHQTIVCVKVIIGVCSDHRLISVRNLFITAVCHIGIELRCMLLMRNKSSSRLACQHVTIGFYHTTIMIVSKTVPSVCSLLGNQHGILAVTEIIALYKDICSFHCTHANLRHTIVVVVPDVYSHGAYTRMARV